MNYELLDGTREIEKVDVSAIAVAYVKSHNRGYNVNNIIFYNDYVSISSPSPTTGYEGEHKTLVCDVGHHRNCFFQELVNEVMEEAKLEGYKKGVWKCIDQLNDIEI